MTVEVITDFNNTVLKENWGKLLKKNRYDNVHLTYEWLKTWWDFYGEGKDLFILLVKKDSEVVGIAPLMISSLKIFPGIELRRVEFIGTGLSDYHDLIIAEEKREVLKAIFDHLKSYDKWQLIRLRHLSECSGNLPYLRQTVNSHNWRVVDRVAVRCPYIPLDTPWDVYFKKSISRNLRRDVKKRINKLKKIGEIRYKRVTDKDEILKYLDSIFSIHQKRWEVKKERCFFPLWVERNKNFLRKITEIFGLKGWLALLLLFSNNRIIAYMYCFSYNDKMYAWNTAFDFDYFQFSPGKVLHKYAIEDLMRSDYKEFDLMRGDETYKLGWTKLMRDNYEIIIYKRSPLSLLTAFYYLRLKPFLEKNRIVDKILGISFIEKLMRR